MDRPVWEILAEVTLLDLFCAFGIIVGAALLAVLLTYFVGKYRRRR